MPSSRRHAPATPPSRAIRDDRIPGACWRLLCRRCRRSPARSATGRAVRGHPRPFWPLSQDDSVGLEHHIDITSHACGIISQSHGGAATTNTSATTARRTRRSPSVVKARSISARPSRTSSGSVTQPPGPWRTGERRACGTPQAPTPAHRPAGFHSSAGNHGRCRTRISVHPGAARSCWAARCSGECRQKRVHRSSPVAGRFVL